MQSEMWCKESITRAPLLQRYDVQPTALTTYSHQWHSVAITGINYILKYIKVVVIFHNILLYLY